MADVAAALDGRDSGNERVAPERGPDDPPRADEEEQKGEDEPAVEEKPARSDPKPTAWASLRKREQALVEKQNSWQSEREEALKEVREWNEVKARCKDDPFAALRLIGWDDGKEFLQRIADSGGSMTPEQKRIYELEKQVAEDRKVREELTQKQQDVQQQAQMQENVKRWHGAIRQHIDASPELKEGLAGVADTEPAVFQVMQAHYAETGEQMDYTHAVKQVAQNLESKIEGVLSELVSNKRGLELVRKIASKITQPAPARQKAPRGITQTISNATGASKAKPRSLDEIVAEQAAWLDSR